jgi:hypothetical protein
MQTYETSLCVTYAIFWTSYEDYAIRDYTDVVVLNSRNTNMRDWRTSEMGTTSGT